MIIMLPLDSVDWQAPSRPERPLGLSATNGRSESVNGRSPGNLAE
jgi:hypothetical protein